LPPLTLAVSWLRIKTLPLSFKVICGTENAQKIVGEDSGLSVICGSENAQKVVGEGGGWGRSVSATTLRGRSVRRCLGTIDALLS
jgi:hypothetical protein